MTFCNLPQPQRALFTKRAAGTAKNASRCPSGTPPGIFSLYTSSPQGQPNDPGRVRYGATDLPGGEGAA